MKGKLAGVILTGGRGHRMEDQDKGLVPFKGKPLFEYSLHLLRQACQFVVVSANRNLQIYHNYGFPVISDLPQYEGMGPLAGIYSAAQIIPPDYQYIQVLPCDTPFLPDDLIEQQHHLLLTTQTDIVMAADTKKYHPTIIQFKRTITPSLKKRLDDPNDPHRMINFVLDHPHAIATYPNERYFVNLNDAKTLKAYEHSLFL